MRALVDESLPVELADELILDGISTVRAQQWLGLRNGVLLRAAVAAGFTVILTSDASLRHQQNLRKIGIAAVVVVGTRNRIEDLRPLLRRIREAAMSIRAGEVVEIAATLRA